MLYDLIRAHPISYRRTHELKQREMAEMLCMAVRTYQRLEKGEKVRLDVAEAEWIADALGFDPVTAMLLGKYNPAQGKDKDNAMHTEIRGLLAIIGEKDKTIAALKEMIRKLEKRRIAVSY